LFGKMVILLQVLMTASLSLFLVNSFSLIDKQRNVRNQGVVMAAFCKYLTPCSSCRWYINLSNMLVPIMLVYTGCIYCLVQQALHADR
jgi:hypothetical protein